MSYKLFAMDTSFYHSLGAYDFKVRCEMLKELGYDATYLTLWSERAWQDVSLLEEVTPSYDLEVAGIYVTLDIAAHEDDATNRRILKLLAILTQGSNLEVSVKATGSNLQNSDPQGDERLISWLDMMLPLAEERGINLLLYPHANFWLERLEDAVRICRKLNHPLLGAVFSGLHWYMVDGKNLPIRLEQAAPYLRSANLCGSRRMQGGDLSATIEPLDGGELDNFVILGLLKKMGYEGMIGIQGYSLGGDVYANLKRSLMSFRDMEQRLRVHPHWAVLR